MTLVFRWANGPIISHRNRNENLHYGKFATNELNGMISVFHEPSNPGSHLHFVCNALDYRPWFRAFTEKDNELEAAINCENERKGANPSHHLAV